MKKKIGLMVMLAIMLVFGMTVVGCGTFAGEVGWAILEGISGVPSGGGSSGSSGYSSAKRTCNTCDGLGIVWETYWQGEGWWITCPTCGGKGEI